MAVERRELAPGHEISRLIRGGWQLAGGHGPVDRARAIDDMFVFLDRGVTTFDCADIYTGAEEMIGKQKLLFEVRAGDNGRLYGSITSGDVAEQLEGMLEFEIDRRRIQLDAGIRDLGIFEVPIRLMPEVIATFKVAVVREGEGWADAEQRQALRQQLVAHAAAALVVTTGAVGVEHDGPARVRHRLAARQQEQEAQVFDRLNDRGAVRAQLDLALAYGFSPAWKLGAA